MEKMFHRTVGADEIGMLEIRAKQADLWRQKRPFGLLSVISLCHDVHQAIMHCNE